MNPKDRLSPTKYLSNLRVIFCTPDWAIAEYLWEGRLVMGICWNGNIEDPNDKGFPRSHGEGLWFELPELVARWIRLGRGLLDLVSRYPGETT